MHRILRLGLLIVLMAVGMGAMPASASAAGEGVFTYQGDGYWKDDLCDDAARGTANHRYEVTIARDQNGGGAKTRLCSAWDTFCDVPLTSTTYWVICNAIGNGSMANDNVSSVYSIWIQSGWDVCLYTNANFTGSKLRLTTQYADVGALGDLNDKFSSIRPRQEGTAC